MFWNNQLKHSRANIHEYHTLRNDQIRFLGFDVDCFYKQVFSCYGVWTTQKDDKPISAGSARTWERNYFSLQTCMETDEVIKQLGKLNGHYLCLCTTQMLWLLPYCRMWLNYQTRIPTITSPTKKNQKHSSPTVQICSRTCYEESSSHLQP